MTIQKAGRPKEGACSPRNASRARKSINPDAGEPRPAKPSGNQGPKPETRLDRAASAFAQACAGAAGGLALGAALAKLAGVWPRAAFLRQVDVPPPATLWFLGFLSFILFVQARRPGHKAVTYLTSGAMAVIFVSGLLALSHEFLGLKVPLATRFSHAIAVAPGTPSEQASVMRVLVLLGIGLALGMGLPVVRRRKNVRFAGLALTAVLLFFSLAIASGYLFGAPFFPQTNQAPLSLVSAVILVTLSLGLLVNGHHNFWFVKGFLGAETKAGQRPSFPSAWPLVVLLALFLGGIASSGYLYLQRQLSDARSKAQAELAAIADLKVRQIADWRVERRNDGKLLAGFGSFVRDLRAFLRGNSREAGARVEEVLDLLQQIEDYRGIAVFDPTGAVRLSSPPGFDPFEPEDKKGTLWNQDAGEVTIHELDRGTREGDVFLDLTVGIKESDTPPTVPFQPARRGAPPEAVILLRIDPARFLFPLVQSWPTKSRTAETLLVRREGDTVLFLNELRHRPDAALNLRLPLETPLLPAAAAARGLSTIMEGRDYRGVRVLSAVRPVGDSPWAMVAKIDQDEIYGPIRTQARTIFVLGLAGALLLISFFGQLWQKRNQGFLSRQLAVERERAALAEQLAHLRKSANDIIILADEAGRVVDVNDRGIESYGYSADELKGVFLQDLQAPGTLDDWRRSAEQLKVAGHGRMETSHRRRDGSIFDSELSARLVRIGERAFQMVIIRDISERKLAEEKLRAALEEKTVLLREVHHRVKNNLQAMISLIQMRSRQVNDESVKQILTQLQEQARTMSLVYEQLFQTDSLARIPMQPYLTALANFLVQAFGGERPVELDVRAEALTMDAARAMPCGLIVNELVTNSLKHGFPAGTSARPAVRVELKREGGEYRLTVSDNGSGLPAGFDGSGASGTGLKLVRLWSVHQLGGTLQADSDGGARFSVVFQADAKEGQR
jgi:PAS domain S-box-containing protein